MGWTIYAVFAIGFLLLAAFADSSTSTPIITTSLIVLVPITIIYVFIKMMRDRRDHANSAFQNRLQGLNAEHGTAFPTDLKALESVSVAGGNTALVFDVQNKKVAYFKNGVVRVVGFDYFRSLKTEMTEYSKGCELYYKDVRLAIQVNDLDHPLMVIPLPSKSDADIWSSRMSMVFGWS
jgi:hypothetical protein